MRDIGNNYFNFELKLQVYFRTIMSIIPISVKKRKIRIRTISSLTFNMIKKGRKQNRTDKSILIEEKLVDN